MHRLFDYAYEFGGCHKNWSLSFEIGVFKTFAIFMLLYTINKQNYFILSWPLLYQLPYCNNSDKTSFSVSFTSAGPHVHVEILTL